MNINPKTKLSEEMSFTHEGFLKGVQSFMFKVTWYKLQHFGAMHVTKCTANHQVFSNFTNWWSKDPAVTCSQTWKDSKGTYWSRQTPDQNMLNRSPGCDRCYNCNIYNSFNMRWNLLLCCWHFFTRIVYGFQPVVITTPSIMEWLFLRMGACGILRLG